MIKTHHVSFNSTKLQIKQQVAPPQQPQPIQPKQTKETEDKRSDVPWYVSAGKFALSTGTIVAASIIGGVVAGPVGAVVAGSMASGSVSAVSQKLENGSVDWGKVAIDGAIGAIPGGLGQAGSKVLGKIGVEVFKEAGEQTLKKALIQGAFNGAVDGSIMGYVGGTAYKAYETGKKTEDGHFDLTKVNWQEANQAGVNGILPGLIGGAAMGSTVNGLVHTVKTHSSHPTAQKTNAQKNPGIKGAIVSSEEEINAALLSIKDDFTTQTSDLSASQNAKLIAGAKKYIDRALASDDPTNDLQMLSNMLDCANKPETPLKMLNQKVKGLLGQEVFDIDNVELPIESTPPAPVKSTPNASIEEFKALERIAKEELGVKNAIYRDNIETAKTINQVLKEYKDAGYDISHLYINATEQGARKTAKSLHVKTNEMGGAALATFRGNEQRPTIFINPGDVRNYVVDAMTSSDPRHFATHEIAHGIHYANFYKNYHPGTKISVAKAKQQIAMVDEAARLKAISTLNERLNATTAVDELAPYMNFSDETTAQLTNTKHKEIYLKPELKDYVHHHIGKYASDNLYKEPMEFVVERLASERLGNHVDLPPALEAYYQDLKGPSF